MDVFKSHAGISRLPFTVRGQVQALCGLAAIVADDQLAKGRMLTKDDPRFGSIGMLGNIG